MKNNDEILIATSNKGKVKEFKKLFQNHNIFSLTDLGIVDAVEDGSSFLENALIKAKHGAKDIRYLMIQGSLFQGLILNLVYSLQDMLVMRFLIKIIEIKS